MILIKKHHDEIHYEIANRYYYGHNRVEKINTVALIHCDELHDTIGGELLTEIDSMLQHDDYVELEMKIKEK